MNYSAALLPTGKTMNPRHPRGAFYYDENQVAIIVDMGGGRLRCLTSFGDLESWTIGSGHEIHHDQTMRRLGFGTVVGKANFKTGHTAGNVPGRALPHWVFK